MCFQKLTAEVKRLQSERVAMKEAFELFQEANQIGSDERNFPVWSDDRVSCVVSVAKVMRAMGQIVEPEEVHTMLQVFT